jgi:hypothetical protein
LDRGPFPLGYIAKEIDGELENSDAATDVRENPTQLARVSPAGRKPEIGVEFGLFPKAEPRDDGAPVAAK